MNRIMIDGMSWAMSDVYAACVDRILINMARHFAFIKKGAPIPGSWEYQVRKLAEMGQVTQESERIILETLGGADEALQGMLEATIRDSLKDVDASLRKAAERGLTKGVGLVPEIAPRQMQAFQAYYQQSADKLNLVNTVMLESTQNAYAATVADIATKIDTTQKILNAASGEVVTGVESFNKVLHDSVRQMVDNGLTGFIDHGGHHWSPEAYVAMDTRTTMTNTGRAAVWEEADSFGVELYQVSSHDGARPLCYPWQGKIISRNGWTGTVEDGEGNKVTVHSESEIESFRYGGGLFGVNCGHYPIPFVPGFSRVRPPKQDEEANAKEYAESQEQRALERKLREERRELAVMKAQGATEDEINAQKIRVKNASANLDDFCQETGRATQRAREYTPVNAQFPDGYKQTKYEQGIRRRDPNSTPTATPAPSAVPAQKPIADRIKEYDERIVKKDDERIAWRQSHTPEERRQEWFIKEDEKRTAEIDKLKEERKSLQYVQNLPNSGITARPLTKWDHTPTTDEIIASLGGRDKTSGSCASLTFAYAGNRGGYNVLDFRGGDSRYHFSMCSNIDKIAHIPGIDGVVIRNRSDFTTAHKLMDQMTEGKEYFFGVAKHAAVVRKTSIGFEYLELQGDPSYNGFKELNDYALKWRFGCCKSHTIAGMAHEIPGELMEIDKMKDNPDFLEVLKYINTAASEQRKGVGGGLR